MTALRAIEFGIPVIRVCFYKVFQGLLNPYGRIIAQIPLNEENVISSYIPLALQSQTFYSSYRDMPVLLFLCLLILTNIFILFKKRGFRVAV